MDGSIAAVGKAVGTPVRFASDFISDLPVNGQINLLTSTSFDQPQNLFSLQNGLPTGVAFVSLSAPTLTGSWNVRGGTTQGDLSSWIVAGSYSWQPSGSSHSYRAGMSYAMQRYLGGNADALAAMSDGRRKAGEMYAFDRWTLTPRLDISYGARYARYDYLANETLFSPKASVTIRPLPHGSLRVRGTVSRREIAPGAEEFIVPSTGMWVPPGRTFSPASIRAGFHPEQITSLRVRGGATVRRRHRARCARIPSAGERSARHVVRTVGSRMLRLQPSGITTSATRATSMHADGASASAGRLPMAFTRRSTTRKPTRNGFGHPCRLRVSRS